MSTRAISRSGSAPTAHEATAETEREQHEPWRGRRIVADTTHAAIDATTRREDSIAAFTRLGIAGEIGTTVRIGETLAAHVTLDIARFVGSAVCVAGALDRHALARVASLPIAAVSIDLTARFFALAGFLVAFEAGLDLTSDRTPVTVIEVVVVAILTRVDDAVATIRPHALVRLALLVAALV